MTTEMAARQEKAHLEALRDAKRLLLAAKALFKVANLDERYDAASTLSLAKNIAAEALKAMEALK